MRLSSAIHGALLFSIIAEAAPIHRYDQAVPVAFQDFLDSLLETRGSLKQLTAASGPLDVLSSTSEPEHSPARFSEQDGTRLSGRGVDAEHSRGGEDGFVNGAEELETRHLGKRFKFEGFFDFFGAAIEGLIEQRRQWAKEHPK